MYRTQANQQTTSFLKLLISGTSKHFATSFLVLFCLKFWKQFISSALVEICTATTMSYLPLSLICSLTQNVFVVVKKVD